MLLKSKSVFVAAVLFAFILSAGFQTVNAGNLPGKAGNPTKVKLPVSVAQFTKSYGKFAKLIPNEGGYSSYEWNLAKGVNVLAAFDHAQMIQKLSVTGKTKTTVIKDCIMGFIINKTTLADCKKKLGEDIDRSLDENGDKEGYKIYQDNYWLYVYFENGILTEITIATWEFDLI